MGIRIDTHHAAEFERLPMPPPVKIQTPRIGIDLDCNAVLCTRTKDFLDIDVITWAPQELPARHMAEDGGAWVGYGCKDAFGLFFPAELELAVHARHNKIKGGKNLVWVIQRAIRQDV
jgi:hypothetical protein